MRHFEQNKLCIIYFYINDLYYLFLDFFFFLKVLNLLNDASDSQFMTRKWNIVNDQSNANCHAENEIIYNTEVLKSNLCDYNDAF